MAKVSLKQLKAAAAELNDVLGLNPPIDVDSPMAVLEPLVKEAIGMVDPEQDEFTEATQAVIDSYGVPVEDEEDVPEEGAVMKPEPDPEEDPDDVDEDLPLDEQVISARSLQELKGLAKVEPVFKGLRSKLTSYKTVDQLRDAMLEALNPVPVEDNADASSKPGSKKGSPVGGTVGAKEGVKSVPKHEGSMAEFLDSVILQGGTWKEMLEKVLPEATRRGSAQRTIGAIRSHAKYRLSKNAQFLGKLSLIEDKGILATK